MPVQKLEPILVLVKNLGGAFFFIGFDDGLWGFFGLGRGLFLWDCFGSRQFGFVGVFCWVFFFPKACISVLKRCEVFML